MESLSLSPLWLNGTQVVSYHLGNPSSASEFQALASVMNTYLSSRKVITHLYGPCNPETRSTPNSQSHAPQKKPTDARPGTDVENPMDLFLHNGGEVKLIAQRPDTHVVGKIKPTHFALVIGQLVTWGRVWSVTSASIMWGGGRLRGLGGKRAAQLFRLRGLSRTGLVCGVGVIILPGRNAW